MNGDELALRDTLTLLVLLLPSENAKLPQGSFYASAKAILDGEYTKVFETYADVLSNPELSSELQNEVTNDENDAKALLKHLKLFVDKVTTGFNAKYGAVDAPVHLHLVAIAFLQLFIQLNYTGPNIDTNLIVDFDSKYLHVQLVELLSLSGQLAYELMEGPLYLSVALIIFEKQMNVPDSASLFNKHDQLSIEDISGFYLSIKSPKTSLDASILWWSVRALQVRTSILPEPESLLSTVSSILLNSSIPNVLMVNSTDPKSKEIQKNVEMIFYLESARINIHSQTEHLALPLLNKAKEVSQFDFILTGAKAKRTKYQNFYTSSLVVLAKSKENSLYSNADKETPETLELNSELLLEKPQYSNIEDLDESDPKRIKLDFSGGVDSGETRLLPIAIKKEDIPKELLELDPNDQPSLNDLDNIQLLLRLTTLKQTTPSGDVLVAEELLALVSRILFSAKNPNWSIFSRSLWERSILETTKAKTIERGILQMTSLVEELGVKIKSRIIPEAQNSDKFVASRLRFIHQLPLLSQWQMDVKLAEKYMSIGLLRSAVDIYERLNMVSDAALCYAAVGEENTAERMLVKRIEEHPNDARAISILGDIKQDPSLWLKAWEVGKYANSQASLAKYFYGQKNVGLAIKHMNLCLSVNPLNYENWFFYGCCGLENQQYELASEAFTRCVALDDTNSHAWSNLALALLQIDKTRQAFNALQKAVRMAGENKSWRIYENYLIVAAKLGEWNDVLIATKELLFLKRDGSGEGSIDIPVVEKLAQVLMISEYPEGTEGRLTHFQSSCIDFICNTLPQVITSSARCWRLIAKVEVWRKRPWAALECYEKAFRAVAHQPDMVIDEGIWNDAVETCSDLVAAYESFGELPGKYGAEDVVCKDWKYKSRTSIRSLMSKGKSMWEGTEGWERLEVMKEEMK